MQDIEFPAVTICNQGWIGKVMAMAILTQYRGYAADQGIISSKNLQFGQNLDLEQKWVTASYPGLKSNPQDFGELLASPNIEKVNESILVLNTNYFMLSKKKT